MNHNNAYHGDINYGVPFSENWFLMKKLHDFPDDEDGFNQFSDFMAVFKKYTGEI